MGPINGWLMVERLPRLKSTVEHWPRFVVSCSESVTYPVIRDVSFLMPSIKIPLEAILLREHVFFSSE